MKRFLVLLMAGVLVAAFTVPALAFEFSLKGQYEQRVQYFSRIGDRDLFGIASLQDAGGPAIGFAGMNKYRGTMATPGAGLTVANPAATNTVDVDSATRRIIRAGGSLYECDTLQEEMRVVLKPTFRVNKAIRVYGSYNIGGIRNRYGPVLANPGAAPYVFGVGSNGIPPFEKYGMMRASNNADDTALMGSWDQLRATIQLPWGVISIGQKDFPLGIGAAFGYVVKGDSLLFVVPYGPFRFLPTVWVARSIFEEDNGGAMSTTPDKGDKWDVFGGCLFTYTNGPLEIGGGAVMQQLDVTRGYMMTLMNTVLPPAVPGRAAIIAAQGHNDTEILARGAFMKYNNGRFFANWQYFNMRIDDHHVGALPVYTEAYHFATEAGVVVGPMKIGLIYGLASGPVLNLGNATQAYGTWGVFHEFLDPYNFLMFHTYGGGNNAFTTGFDSDDHGSMTDAYCFAGRIDYACASNLNLYLSYMWAHRLEVAGTLAGSTLSSGAAAGTAGVGAAYTVAAAQQWKANHGYGASPNPYVDDGFIGYEWNVGVDWKLLEGLTLKQRYSFWQPGEWFDQAYRAVTMFGGAIDQEGRMVGRDPIHSFQGSLVIDF